MSPLHPNIQFQLLDNRRIPAGEQRRQLCKRLIELDSLAAAGLVPGQRPNARQEQSLSASSSHWACHNNFLDHIDGLVLAKSDSELIGFTAFTVWQVRELPIQFLNYAAVRRDCHRTGILTRLTRLAGYHMVQARFQRWYATARTVNPAVLQAWLPRRPDDHALVYPDVRNTLAIALPEVEAVAREVCRRTYPGATFDPATFVARRSSVDLHLMACATGILSVDPPCVTADVSRFFDSHVDASAGDAVIVVKPVDRRAGPV